MTTTTTIAVPTSCAALCTKPVELAQHIEDDLVQAGSGAAIDYGAIEQRVADALGESERGLHAQVLARLDIDVPAIRVWGDEYRRIGRFKSDYHTLTGTVRVMRTVYRKAGRNGDTLDPVSVRAGVVADGWLPHTARAMAHLLAQGTSRGAEATGRELARLPYSQSSFERVGHEVGTLCRRAQARIEEVLIQEYAVPAEARSVSISIDRVALPMEEPIEAPLVPVDPPWVAAVMSAAPPHPAEVQAVLDEQNQGDGPKVARNFRMAYVATVTLHDGEGESLHTIRYGRMPKGDARGLCRALARDVTAMRAQRPELKVAYLTDGASEFETLYDQHLKLPLGPDAVSLVDFWHAAEYLGAAARVFEVKRKAKPGQFRRWRHTLKHDEGAAARIVEQLEQSGLEKVMLNGVRPIAISWTLSTAAGDLGIHVVMTSIRHPVRRAPDAWIIALVVSACSTAEHRVDLPHPIREAAPRSLADHHVHLFSPESHAVMEQVVGSALPPFGVPELDKALDDGHVIRAAVLSVAYLFAVPGENTPEQIKRMQDENDWTAAQVGRDPGRLVALFSVNPLADEALAEIDRCADRQVFVGAKLHLANSKVDLRDPAHVARLRAVFAKLDARRLAIVIHMRTTRDDYGRADAEVAIRDLLPAAPDVPIQIAHAAGWGGYDVATDSALAAFGDALAAHPRAAGVSFDLSAVVRGVSSKAVTTTWWPQARYQRLTDQMRRIGLEHFVFGTDWPEWTPAKYRDDLARQLPLTTAELDVILTNRAPWLRGG